MNCQICHDLHPPTIHNLKPRQSASILTTLDSLRHSAKENNCPSCNLIWDALALQRGDVEVAEGESPVELRLGLEMPLKVSSPMEGIHIELFSRPDELSPSLPTIGPAIEVSSISSSEECFGLAKSWLDTCVNSHPDCPKANSLNPLPTRVIDVCLDGTREPFLLETSGQKGHYIALSYCWGNPQTTTFLTTTASSLSAHKHEIPFKNFPKTLQDAVTITCRLQIPYLWIDALCILQGDLEDWSREAGKMCEVYSHAHLTLAISCSSSSSEGCFRLQDFATPPHTFPYQNKAIYARKQVAREHNRLLLLLQSEDHVDPINRRAWTLQESMLSNRVLHYTLDEMVWECNSWFGCQCGHSNQEIEIGDEYSSRVLRNPELEKQQSLQQLYEKWDDIIAVFTERNLTVDGDRLPALSGLAKQFAFILKERDEKYTEYLAGLWEGDLVKGLLWSIEDDMYTATRDKGFSCRRPREWRAPSWSWAAVEGTVKRVRLGRKFQSRIQLLDWSITAKTPLDPYGQVTAGKIVLRGLMVHQVAISEDHDNNGFKNNIAGFNNGTRYCVRKNGESYVVMCDEVAEISFDIETYSCLLVGVIDWWGQLQRFFLILKLSDSVGGVWERVGMNCLTIGLNPSKNICAIFDDASAVEETVTII